MWPAKKEEIKEKIKIKGQNDNILGCLASLSIENKINGNHKAVCKILPHSIQEIENPQKAKANEPSIADAFFNLRFFKYKNINKEARRGCKKI